MDNDHDHDHDQFDAYGLVMDRLVCEQGTCWMPALVRYADGRYRCARHVLARSEVRRMETDIADGRVE